MKDGEDYDDFGRSDDGDGHGGAHDSVMLM